MSLNPPSHLYCLNQLRRQAVLRVPQTQLPVLVTPKAVQLPALDDYERVGVAARHVLHLVPAEEGDGLRDEDICAVAVAKPAEITPALWNGCWGGLQVSAGHQGNSYQVERGTVNGAGETHCGMHEAALAGG